MDDIKMVKRRTLYAPHPNVAIIMKNLTFVKK